MKSIAEWEIVRRGNGHMAIIRFKAGEPGPIQVAACGGSEGQAIARAAVIARQLAENPIISAVAPPGTAAAIKAIDAIAKSKDVRRVMRRFVGPGAKRLAKALRKFW